MRIALAGALGEVGSSLCHALLNRGHDVLHISSRQDIATDSEIMSVSAAAQRISDGAIDVVVNAAGPGDRRVLERNVLEPAQQLADAAQRAGIPAILISTVRVLEGYSNAPLEDAPPSPETVYAQRNTELEEEWMLRSTASTLRMANFFGAPKNPHSPQTDLLPWSLLREGWQTGEIRVRSGAQAMKEFVDANDVARAIETLVESGVFGVRVATSPGVRLTMAQLATASADACHTFGIDVSSFFGSDNSSAEPPRATWLTQHGWHCQLTLGEMTRIMTAWLVEWGRDMPRVSPTTEGE